MFIVLYRLFLVETTWHRFVDVVRAVLACHMTAVAMAHKCVAVECLAALLSATSLLPRKTMFQPEWEVLEL